MVGRATVANSFWNQVSQNGSDKEIGRLKHWHKLPQSDSPIWCPLQNEVCYTKWFRPWKNEILPPHTKKLGEDQKQMLKKNTNLPNGVHLHMAKKNKILHESSFLSSHRCCLAWVFRTSENCNASMVESKTERKDAKFISILGAWPFVFRFQVIVILLIVQ